MKTYFWLLLPVMLASFAVTAAVKPLTPEQRNDPFPQSPAQQQLKQQMQSNAQQQKTRMLQQQEAQRDTQRNQLKTRLDNDRQRAQQNAPLKKTQQNP
ncbi:DUF2756 domain-containing protein [Acerihabitans arboris]|uniref:DUF2756 domain-containing protein n=1 Tax=Acerihabitans arboris TaxID=2691583 RepID=A0A845SNP0_9GAMM|nr:DUF2756 domain-containing protein [Acerihabitans arboris]NDL64544.1 DUF2756 domain-containing protein [Acerihabitans arboris]